MGDMTSTTTSGFTVTHAIRHYDGHGEESIEVLHSARCETIGGARRSALAAARRVRVGEGRAWAVERIEDWDGASPLKVSGLDGTITGAGSASERVIEIGAA